MAQVLPLFDHDEDDLDAIEAYDFAVDFDVNKDGIEIVARQRNADESAGYAV